MTTGILLALAGSFVFVFAALGVGVLLFRTGVVDGFVSRKIIHITVAHWWFFHQFLIVDPLWGLVGPVFFLLFNLAARQHGFLKAMEPGKGESNLGTVYFPISLIVAVVFSGWGGMPTWVAGLGILVLGWGDGLAALVGKAWGRHLLPITWSRKTWEGTLALVLASTVVILVFLMVFTSPANGLTPAWLGSQLAKATAVALVLALVEALTPLGLDNLLLPLTASALVWVFL